MAYNYKVGNQNVELQVDPDRVAIRFKEPAKYSTRASVTEKHGMGQFQLREEVPDEKFTILPVGQQAQSRGDRHSAAIQSLDRESEVARVAPVFKIGDTTVIATDRILMGFQPGAEGVEQLLEKYKAEVVSSIGDEYVIQLDESADPIPTAERLAEEDIVTYAEPDFVSMGSHVSRLSQLAPSAEGGDPRSSEQYAPTITRAVEAWALQTGDPNVRIAILDEGVDMLHEDLSPVIVGSYDATDDDTFQEPNDWDGHGTACAGLAAAIHGNDKGVKGIGGGCSILAVRIAYSEAPRAGWVTRNSWIARAIDWSWQNGADILSNSWGGGAPSTAIANAFERARTQGRGGKGCVNIVAAGNSAGPVSFPGSLSTVLTVSASNEFDEFKTKTSRDGESWWGSNFGPEVDVAAPGVHNLTTDISGAAGYTPDNYTDFNGTSSATPIVAGAAGLILSANSELTEEEVRDIIKQSADRAGDLPYTNGRNDQFGNGRLNVLSALELARPVQDASNYVTTHKVVKEVAIADRDTGRISVAVGDMHTIRDIKVHVEIKHTYIGDLTLRLFPPGNSGESPVILHNRTGRGKDDLITTYDQTTTPDLGRFVGKVMAGDWMLEVSDFAAGDEGKINSFALELTY